MLFIADARTFIGLAFSGVAVFIAYVPIGASHVLPPFLVLIGFTTQIILFFGLKGKDALNLYLSA